MTTALLYPLVLLGFVHRGQALCGRYTDCYSCARKCNWCARDNACHSPIWVNFIDPCHKHKDDIKEANTCPVKPEPNDADLPLANNIFAKGVLGFLLKRLNITDVNITTCLADVGRSDLHFHDFALDLKHKSYRNGITNLNRGISALANSVSGCGLPEVQQKLDSFAASIRFVNISTNGLDKGVKAIVGASDMWKDFEGLEKAIQSKDTDAIGDALSKTLDDWTTVEGGCGKHVGAVCKVVDGLMRVLAVTAKEIMPCEDSLKPAVDAIRKGAQSIKSKDYKAAIESFALALDILAKATSSDACGLKHIGDAVGALGSKLAAAVVKVEDSKPVQILVGSADVYDDLYILAEDFEKKDYTGVGAQLGLLVAKLKSSDCKTPMCTVVQGFLGAMQVGFTDFKECSADLDKTWEKMQTLFTDLKTKKWKHSILTLGDTIKQIGDDVEACGVQPISQILQDTSNKFFYGNAFAADLGKATKFFVSGADITPDIQKILADATNKQWSSLGSDLGALSSYMNSKECNTFACKITEGILDQAGMVFKDLKPCEDSLRPAEQDFVNGAELWGRKDHKHALNFFASGLKQISKSVDACGLPSELKFIEQEANVLGLGNSTGIGEALSILVHGKDLGEDISGAVEAFQKQDYRAAGSKLQKTLNEMFTWTTGHLCTKDACYVLSGVLQYLNDLATDLKTCKHDFVDMMRQFHNSYEELTEGKSGTSLFKGFTKNKTAIEAGIGDIGHAIKDLANGVMDCHLPELAQIIERLAVKLGVVPEVAVVDEVLKILIEGVAIEREIAEALEDFGAKNWPAFGYNLIKLSKDLVKTVVEVEVVV